MSGALAKKVLTAALDLAAVWRGLRNDDSTQRAALAKAVDLYLSPAPKIEQGRSGRHAAGGGHYIAPQVAGRLIDLLKLGLSHRAIRSELGVAKGTVHRYEVMHGPFRCPCGRERTHRGWCSERLKRSPARIIFLRNWTAQQIAAGTRVGRSKGSRTTVLIDRRIALSNYPYLRGRDDDGARLIEAVNSVVPRTFPDHMRADICQDLLLSVLEGESTIEQLKAGTSSAVRKYYKLHPGKFGPISLDAPIPGTENLTLIDTIPSDAAHF